MKLYLNTVSDSLWTSLQKLMTSRLFDSFRLVGGTSLSLQLGHRESVDIDLFTDSKYGSIDFDQLDSELRTMFSYVDMISTGPAGMGMSFFIGEDQRNSVKLDLFYTEPFVFPILVRQNVRFSSVEEVAAMKLEVIAQGGRKKDFWDCHELLNQFTLYEMIDFYLLRNPYGFTKDELLIRLIDFSVAEDDFTPICYRGKDWELIKLDLEDSLSK